MRRAKCSVSSCESSAQTGRGPLPAARFLPDTPHSPLATCHCAPKAGAGFTMIELLVVIAIIAVLAGLTLSTLGYVNRKGAESRARAEVAALSTAIDSFFADYAAYPASNNLFRELTAQGPVNTNKVYFEPTPNITTNMAAGPFIDPWGSPYRYTTNPTVNVGFFDLWTTNNDPRNSNNWIRN